VKNIIVPLASVAFIISFNSCTDVEGSNINMPLPATKEKKPTALSKNKKKERKKTVTVYPKTNTTVSEKHSTKEREKSAVTENTNAMNVMAIQANAYATTNGYSVKYCFLIDMVIPSGRDRFFVYDFEKKSVVLSGLVAHGSCNETFLSHPRFSNQPKCGCSSLGKYKVGEFYRGKYGKSYRLYGLDKSNSNAYRRAVVIHGYGCVPDKEIYPMVLCNSEGCAMVSYNFFDKLSRIIANSDEPILLWIYQ